MLKINYEYLYKVKLVFIVNKYYKQFYEKYLHKKRGLVVEESEGNRNFGIA